MAETDNPVAQLAQLLRTMRLEAGDPSTRDIARRTGGAISHTAVHQLLAGRRAGRWGPVEVVVEALGGDLDDARRVWKAGRAYELAEERTVKEDAPPHAAAPPSPRHYLPANDWDLIYVREMAAYEVARHLHASGRTQEALDLCVRESRASAPHRVTDLDVFRVRLLTALNKWAEVEEVYERVKSCEANHAHVAHFFSDLCAEYEDLAAAAAFARRATQLDPENAFYHWSLALILTDLNQRDAALRHFRRANAAAPRSSTYAYCLMEVLIQEGRYAEAASVGANVPEPVGRDADHWQVQRCHAQALALLGRLSEAAELLRPEAEAGNTFCVLERARILEHAGDVDGALEQLRKETKSKDAKQRYGVEALRILRRAGRGDEAAALLEAITGSLNDPEAWDDYAAPTRPAG
ncbi:hypothetical protein [Streptomyces sp. NPDC093225]|uniref:tetratricopeptide repeat protein n=1 Tax=Streptomyces sp. NPDC093225 TaxID=3366034 RepID=UPI003818B5C8